MGKTKSRGNGDGTIYKSETRGWVGQISLGRDANGKLVRKTVYAKTRAEVKAKLEKIKSEYENGECPPISEITVHQLIEELIEDDLKMNHIAEGTYSRKLSTLKVIDKLDVSQMCIQNVTEEDIKSSLYDLTPYSDSVISKVYGLLRRCFDVAIHRDIIAKSPMSYIKKPHSDKQVKKVRALTIEEQRKLINILQNTDIKYKTQMLLMMYTGMRMGEINALDLNDVDLTFKTITVRRTLTKDSIERTIIGDTTKTYAGQRKIPLTSQAIELLRDYLQKYEPNKEHLLFHDDKKEQLISVNQVNQALHRLLEKYNIIDKTVHGDVTCHSLRHTYATRCIEGGMSAKVLQSLLGHSDISITLNTYCDAFAEYQEKHVDIFEQYMTELFTKSS